MDFLQCVLTGTPGLHVQSNVWHSVEYVYGASFHRTRRIRDEERVRTEHTCVGRKGGGRDILEQGASLRDSIQAGLYVTQFIEGFFGGKGVAAHNPATPEAQTGQLCPGSSCRRCFYFCFIHITYILRNICFPSLQWRLSLM